MDKLLIALIFAAASMFGLGTGLSSANACPAQSAQAEDATGSVQLAMDEPEDDADDGDSDDDDSDDGDGADE